MWPDIIHWYFGTCWDVTVMVMLVVIALNNFAAQLSSPVQSIVVIS